MARLALDGVPAAELALRWGVPQCGLFRQLPSTLDAVHDLGAQGAPAGTTVDAVLGRAEARLKWPNDVLLAERKLAGILCEGRWQGDAVQWLAVGVGVNVCNPVPNAVARQAVALAEWVPAVRRLDLLDQLVPAVAALTAGVPTLSEPECAAFAARDWLLGRQLRAPAAGRARGLRPDGALLVDLGPATVAVREGHVELA